MVKFTTNILPSRVVGRAQLDRRRLEDAHLKYSVLQVFMRYSHFKDWCIAPNVHQTLKDVTPSFYEMFSERYSCKLVFPCGVTVPPPVSQ